MAASAGERSARCDQRLPRPRAGVQRRGEIKKNVTLGSTKTIIFRVNPSWLPHSALIFWRIRPESTPSLDCSQTPSIQCRWQRSPEKATGTEVSLRSSKRLEECQTDRPSIWRNKCNLAILDLVLISIFAALLTKSRIWLCHCTGASRRRRMES